MAFTKFRHGDAGHLKAWTQFEKQIREANEKNGTECFYISKENYEESLANGVYLEAIYSIGQEIWLRIEGMADFGDDNIYSKFGYEVNTLLTLFGTISQFDDLEDPVVPKPGDIIYIGDTNKKLFEVTDSTYETKNNKYPFGKPMSYQLSAKVHPVDLINFYNTQDEDVDSSNQLDVKTDEKMTKEIDDKITDNNIVDDSEENPLLDE